MTEHLPQEAPAAVAFAERLLAAEPGLRPAYERIVGELRAEGVDSQGVAALVSEYTRELLENPDAAPSALPELSELSGLLEREYGADAAVDTVIESAFVLQMGERRPTGDPADLLGPKLRRLVDEERAWRAAPADAALVERMLAAAPGLRELTAENTWGDHGDVLVHGFLADVVRREVENVEAAQFEEPRAVVELLESLFHAEGGADEAIAVSFVENLPYPGEAGQPLIALLGPKLRAELEGQRGSLGG